MSDTTKIQWADATFNPWIGCTKVSLGCKNCYAENTTRARVLRSQGQETWGKGATRNRTSAATWREPVKWNAAAQASGKRPRIFPSLCDWLDDEVTIRWLADFLKLVHDTPHLDWLLLTKRPENWRRRIEAVWIGATPLTAFSVWLAKWLGSRMLYEGKQPPANVWLGTSVENQETADKRIPALHKIPAKVRFLSVEPMLGPIDLKLPAFKALATMALPCGGRVVTDNPTTVLYGEPIHWAIFGGESGKAARPCHVEWIAEGLRQCRDAGVAAFVKQLGSVPVTENANQFDWPESVRLHQGKPSDEGFAFAYIKTEHPKGGDPAEWPDDLQVREFPKRS